MPVGIPVLRIKRDVANYIFSKTNRTVADLEEKLNASRKPQSFPVNLVINARAEVLREMNTTRNVAMILRAKIKALKMSI